MRKKKIAILGGGVGAMTAAFAITETPNWSDLYEITVYQMGWRLGGKGASGRNPEASQIEEHGLHVWFGFYENAFRLIRKVYDAARPLVPDSPLADVDKAFQPQDGGTLTEFIDGEWTLWHSVFPVLPGRPGERYQHEQPPSPWDFVLRLVDWIASHHGGVHDRVPSRALDDDEVQNLLEAADELSLEFAARLNSRARTREFGATDLIAMASDLVHGMETPTADSSPAPLNFLLQLLTDFLQVWVWPAASLGHDIRRLAVLFDLATAMIRGMITSGVILSGFDVINDQDFARWLKSNGARFTDSVVVRFVYDACFAYRNGTTPAIEAGSALRGTLRLFFDYRGSAVWKMSAGMGDTIFAPLYLVLQARGVKFQFFQRVKNISLSADRKSVQGITLDVQAILKGAEYQPLITVGGLPCWPDAPLYDQIADADQIRGYDLESWYTPWHDQIGQTNLTAGVDFDDVVLGISLGALPYICPELIAANSAWSNMVAKIETAQTQALQLWLHKSAQDLGWACGAPLPPDRVAFVGGYLEPFDTYADMTHLLVRECWKPADQVRHIAYFCNVLQPDTTVPAPFTDPTFPGRQLARVDRFVNDFLNGGVHVLWPNSGSACMPGTFDQSLIRRLFRKANIDPPELYVLSTPGSSAYRLDPGNSGFSNLYLAGDWTRSGLNTGCVEAAVMSGLAAAQSLTGAGPQIYGFSTAERFHLALNVVRTLGSGDDIRKFWQRQAEAKLPPESQVIARNAAITAVYMQIYRGFRSAYKWAGMASFASQRIGLLLLAYDFQGIVAVSRHGSSAPLAEGLAGDIDIMRITNNGVYADIAWAHLAYQAVGLSAVLAGLESLPDHEYMVSGFQKIDQGRGLLSDPHQAGMGADLIWSGNQDLLFHEQSQLVQPAFESLDLLFEDVLTLATTIDFNTGTLLYDPTLFTSFIAFMSTVGLPILIGTGLPPQIVNFKQRWFWILKCALPIWKRVDAASEAHNRERWEGALLRESLKAAATEVAGLWPVEKRPA